ncbi:MAG TPA: Uma2 family endonuclease [Polyangiaceae bacterium LLY-WYZ-14_1]|nr:Uma2 family endonuclease [Polyangiaceae bacterium LLY-WYZ-14_1]
MSTAKRLHYSYAEYLGMLDQSELKLEYCDGAVYAMAGGSVAHAALSANLVALLKGALPEGCKVFTSDLKVRIAASNMSTFPDVSVVCGPVETADVDANAVINPVLLVEVTSRSTEDYDRGDKLSHYRQLPSLQAVLFVSHRSRDVTLVERTATGWDERIRRGGERLVIVDPPAALAVDDIYAGVALDPV